MTIKIGLCGAHSSGKTALAIQLFTKLEGSFVISEVAREFEKHELMKCKTQHKIFVKQMAREVVNKNLYKYLICDRTVIDNLAYMNHFCKNISDYKYIVSCWASTYDYIFFCSTAGVPLQDDGYRFVDDDDQPKRHEIEQFILDYMDDYDIQYIILNGDKQERLEKALAVIEGRVKWV